MCNFKNVSLFYYPYNIPGIGSYKKGDGSRGGIRTDNLSPISLESYHLRRLLF